MATHNGMFKCKRKLDDGNVYAYLKRLKMSKGNTTRFARLLKDNNYNFDVMKGKKAGQLIFSIDVTDESQNKKELKKLIHALKSSLNKKQMNHIDETVVKSKSSEIVNELINCYEKTETLEHAGDGNDIGDKETDRGSSHERGNSNSDDSVDNASDKSALDKLNKTHVEEYITEKEKKKEMRRLEKERKKEEKTRKKEEKKREKEEIKRIISQRKSRDKESSGSKSRHSEQSPASETNDLCYEELKKLYKDLKNKMEYIENNREHGNKQTDGKQITDNSEDSLDDRTEPTYNRKTSHKHSKRQKQIERIKDHSEEDIKKELLQSNKNETNRNQRKTEGKVSFEDMKNREKKKTNRKRAPKNQSSSRDTSSRSSSKGKDKRNRSPRKTKIKTKKVQSTKDSKEIKKPSRKREIRKTLRASYALRNESKLKTLSLTQSNRAKSRKLSTYVPHRSTLRNNPPSITAKYGQNKSFQIKRDKTLGMPTIIKQQQSNHNSNLPPKLGNHSKLPSNHCNILPPKYNNQSALPPRSRTSKLRPKSKSNNFKLPPKSSDHSQLKVRHSTNIPPKYINHSDLQPKNDSKLPAKAKSNDSKLPPKSSDHLQLPVRNSTETTPDIEYKDKTLMTKYSSERIACSESLQTFISKLL